MISARGVNEDGQMSVGCGSQNFFPEFLSFIQT